MRVRPRILKYLPLPCLPAALFLAAACGSDSTSSGNDPGGGTTPPTKPGLGVGAACTAEDPCRTGLDCVGGVCEPARSLPEGSVCIISAECEVGLYCDPQNRCAPAGSAQEGEGCATDVDCASGLKCGFLNFALVCQPEGETDVGGPCATSADCYGGLACQAATCQQLPADAPPYGVPSWAGETCDDDPTKSAMAYFEVPRASGSGDFYRLPFPNDIRLKDGRPDLSGHPTPGTELLGFDPLDPFLRAIEGETEGWGVYPTVIFRFSNDVDWSSFNNDVNPGAIRWVDITPETSTYSFTRGWFSESNGARTKYLCPNWTAVRPPIGEPLTPGHTYAVILSTAGLADDKATPIRRSPDFEAMLEDEPPVEIELREAHERYQIFRDYLQAEAIGKDLILNAAVFTVGPVRKPAETLASTIAELSAPTTSGWVRCGDAPSPCPQAEGDRACGDPSSAYDELHALVSLPIFQHGTAPYLTSADGGGFQRSGEAYEVARTEQVCLSLTIPKNATMPDGGWPLVVFAHGTGGSFRSHVTLGLSESLASADGDTAFAVLGIDQVQHGPRRGSSDASPNDLFFNFRNPAAAKYNALQGAADQMSLIRLVSAFELDAATSPTGEEIRMDADRITFWGHSQGATEGSIGIPYTEGVKGVVLSGNGASLMDSLITKTSPVNIAAAMPYVLSDIDAKFDLPHGIMHPALSLLQTWIDSSDPVAYASVMSYRPPVDGTVRHVFQPFGQKDTYSTARTQVTYIIGGFLGRVADDASVVVADPNDDREMAPVKVGTSNAGNLIVGGQSVTALTRRYGADGYDGHFVAFRNESAHADVVSFLAQSVGGATPPQVGP